VKHELRTLSDYAWERFRRRIDGMTDDEYLWEPVAGCLTVRRGDDGVWRADNDAQPQFPQPEPPPFTTIAWRACHIAAMLGAERNATWLGLTAPPVPFDPGPPHPGNATDVLEHLDRAYASWSAILDALTDEQLAQPIGAVGGRYGDDTRAAFVLHELDELIHHTAEISVLRDLYRDRAR
jgi:hypothetical protein